MKETVQVAAEMFNGNWFDYYKALRLPHIGTVMFSLCIFVGW